jgi:hypothetical protein
MRQKLEIKTIYWARFASFIRYARRIIAPGTRRVDPLFVWTLEQRCTVPSIACPSCNALVPYDISETTVED